MAKLDELYAAWWHSTEPAETRASYDALLLGVLAHAKRSIRDEDLASDVVVVVLSGIERFTRATPDGFSRWVSTIVRRTRAAGYRTAATTNSRYVDADCDSIAPADDYYLELGELPANLKLVAELIIQGYSIKDIAPMVGTSPNTLRQRLWRHRVTKHGSKTITS